MVSPGRCTGCLFLALLLLAGGRTPAAAQSGDTVRLPRPRVAGGQSVEEAITGRRSVRSWTAAGLTSAELSQLLWAAQGVTSPGRRAAPSAGARYPLELLAAVGDVTGVPAGLYRFLPESQSLVRLKAGDSRPCLVQAASGQSMLARAPVVLLFTAVPARTSARYGERTDRYVAIETGASAENVYLQATALGLGTVAVGAFRDEAVAACAALPAEVVPVLLMPVGRREG